MDRLSWSILQSLRASTSFVKQLRWFVGVCNVFKPVRLTELLNPVSHVQFQDSQYYGNATKITVFRRRQSSHIYCPKPDEVTPHIPKAKMTFKNLRHLWRRHDIELSTKGRFHTEPVISILLYDSKIWRFRTVNMWRLSTFGHRYFPLEDLSEVNWFNHLDDGISPGDPLSD